MPIPIFQVDAFTNRPLSGNPAAVCLLTESRNDAWMQAVAAEMNLAETAFLAREGNEYRLRWFTPTIEVDLCGHATLASAHVLWSQGHVEPGKPIRFHTRSGVLTATRSQDRIELDFPLDPPSPVSLPADLLEALNLPDATYMGRGRFDYLIEVTSEDIIRSLVPDFTRLARVPARGIIVTSSSPSKSYDFVSRFFAPAAGVNEDPVTGSAHCCLGAHWQGRLGKAELVGYQASARGGFVSVHVRGDRAILGGQAVTVLRGELVTP